MKIKEIQVEGFGVWKGLTLESLSQDVNVFYGENEAGKTTLMHFVRSMMFGPSADRREKYLPPLYGGAAGGTVALHSSHGDHELRRQFESALGDSSDVVTITDRERGHCQGETAWNEILSEMDETIFNNVFAIGLRGGGGLLPAWRGLLAFSVLRATAHLSQLPRLLRSLSTATHEKSSRRD